MTQPMQGQRLMSLDAFRGATIAGMILVNNPGTWSDIYPQLRHAEWYGWTFTDWIFPFFLFIVGVAMTFSFAMRRERGDTNAKLHAQVLKRSLLIFAFGMFLAGFPYFHLSTIRIPGVLQRIAVCFCIASFIMLHTNVRGQVYWLLGLLASYWLIMMYLPVPGAGSYEKGNNFAAYIDSLVLDGHMWSVSKTWDPEGTISTIPAVATTLFGMLTGHWLRSKRSPEEKTAWMFVAGNLLLLLGAILDIWQPISKSIWTSSYSIFMAGWALVCLACFYFLIDVKGYKAWAKPFVIYGMNAIAIFVLSGIVGRLTGLIKVDDGSGAEVTLHGYVYGHLFAPYASPVNASLLFAICFVLATFLVAWGMWKKKWFLKV